MKLIRKEIGRYPLWHSEQGWRARIAIIYPAAGFHQIGDFHKLAPKGVAIGGTAIPRHKDEGLETVMRDDRYPHADPEMDAKVVAAAKLLAPAEPDVIGWICTAGSFLKGKGHDQRLIKEMEAATRIPCMTTSTAMLAAFKQLGIKKLAMATPYPFDVNQVEKKFIEDNGVSVVSCDGLDLIDPNLLHHLPSSVIYRLGKAIDTPDADGVFLSCTGLNALDVIDALEQDLGKPVMTSNQVSHWMAFRMAGVREAIPGYGRLMREPLNK